MSAGKFSVAQAAEALRGFIAPGQLAVILNLCRGEEGRFYRDRMVALASIVTTMPKTYDQVGKGNDAAASLHYFVGGCDWWITERDAGAADDTPDQFQSQAFGLADLGYGAELGYISLPEILANGAELDLHFTPATLRAIRDGKRGAA